MEELRKNPTFEYWEKVSAAIGYAVYNREVDTDFASVFKRADSEMYKNKKKHESHPPGLILSPTGSNIFYSHTVRFIICANTAKSATLLPWHR